MKTVLNFGDANQSATHLLLEAGPDGAAAAALNAASGAITWVRWLESTGSDFQGAALDALIEQAKEQGFEQVFFNSRFPQAMLLPQRFSGEAKGILQSWLGSSDDVLLDRVPEWQLHIAYSLPAVLIGKLEQGFGNISFGHAYALFLKNIEVEGPEGMEVYITHRCIQVIVKREGALQLAQAYEYETPMDVTYLLLKLFEEFGLRTIDTPVILSGLIEKQSALYKELHQYFGALRWSAPPRFDLPNGELPPYYLSSILKLAACVS